LASQKTNLGTLIQLGCKGWPKAPQQVVDFEQCIYIIGYQYYCGNDDCKWTYQSWSSALLTALPQALSAHFSFHLTHHSGLTDQVVSLMQTSFLHGIGPASFTNILCTNHICHYEHLHIQYLEMIYAQLHSPFANAIGKYEPFGLWDDLMGYGGKTPTVRYFHVFYVKFLASHVSEIDQYTSMLSAKILTTNHSFKVCPRLVVTSFSNLLPRFQSTLES
jgi:hypothetical protein